MRFKLLGFPIEVSWSAGLVLAFIVLQAAGDGSEASRLVAAICFGLALFGSILVHELGHAVVGRRIGLAPRGVVVHGFGGLTVYGRLPTPKKGVLAALAGPVAGLLLGLVSFILVMVLGTVHPIVESTLWTLVTINFIWSLFNLLPMFPLDGGAVMRHALCMVTDVGRANAITRWVSVGVAALVGVAAYLMGQIFVVIIVAFVLMQNLRSR